MPSAPTAERVLVDTSVWVDFFRNRPAAIALISKLAAEHCALICGTILQETLQDAKTEMQLEVLREQMALWHFEAEQLKDFTAAADLCARLRWQGVTVPPADCLLSALALRCATRLCSPDAHFERMPVLKLHRVNA